MESLFAGEIIHVKCTGQVKWHVAIEVRVHLCAINWHQLRDFTNICQRDDITHAGGSVTPEMAVQSEHIDVWCGCKYFVTVNVCSMLAQKFEEFTIKQDRSWLPAMWCLHHRGEDQPDLHNLESYMADVRLYLWKTMWNSQSALVEAVWSPLPSTSLTRTTWQQPYGMASDRPSAWTVWVGRRIHGSWAECCCIQKLVQILTCDHGNAQSGWLRLWPLQFAWFSCNTKKLPIAPCKSVRQNCTVASSMATFRMWGRSAMRKAVALLSEKRLWVFVKSEVKGLGALQPMLTSFGERACESHVASGWCRVTSEALLTISLRRLALPALREAYRLNIRTFSMWSMNWVHCLWKFRWFDMRYGVLTWVIWHRLVMSEVHWYDAPIHCTLSTMPCISLSLGMLKWRIGPLFPCCPPWWTITFL